MFTHKITGESRVGTRLREDGEPFPQAEIIEEHEESGGFVDDG